MATSNIAKNFELKFRTDWQKIFPEGICLRLNDQMSGYKNVSQNPSDFICFANGKFFFCEIKTHKGASIPFEAIPQYDRLKKYISLPNVFCGIILWLYETDCDVLYIPISTIKQMKADGLKSVGIRHLDNEKYKIYRCPTLKRKPVFLDTDYSILMNLNEGE